MQTDLALLFTSAVKTLPTKNAISHKYFDMQFLDI